jgi:hypothetical protein
MAKIMAKKDSSSVCREERLELLEHRAFGRNGDAEIAGGDLTDIARVLLPDRQIEAELLLELFVAGGGDAMLAGHGQDRIAGQQPDEGEGADGDADEGRDQEGDFVEKISEHRRIEGGGAKVAPPRSQYYSALSTPSKR